MTLGDLAARAGAWLWPILVWISTGLLVVLLRSKTPAQWIALGERNPRAQGAIRLLRGLGLDPAKVVDGLVQLLTGRVRPLAAERLSPEQRYGLERARTALLAVAVGDQKPEDRAALARLDELLRADAAPTNPSRDTAGGAGGFATLSVLGAIALATVLAALLSGCAGGQPRLSPIAPRLVMREDYGTCIESGGKLEVPSGPTFALVTQACMMMDAGLPAAPDASAPLEPTPEPVPESIPDKADAEVRE